MRAAAGRYWTKELDRRLTEAGADAETLTPVILVWAEDLLSDLADRVAEAVANEILA